MFHPDDTIDPYTLLRTLGRGAFGEVWLAEKRSSLLTTKVALKLPMVAENEVEKVRQEAALWLKASGHPNIMPVMDAEVYDSQVVIASEFIAGGSLHEWMETNEGRAPSLEGAGRLASYQSAYGDAKPWRKVLQYTSTSVTGAGKPDCSMPWPH